MSLSTKTQPRGVIAILMLVGVSVFTVAIMVTVATLTTRQAKNVEAEVATEQTFFSAEAALNKAIYDVIADSSPRTIPPYTIGNVPVSVVVAGNGFQRIITATASDTTGKVRKLQVTVNASGFAGGFNYGTQTDKGGIDTAVNSNTINGDAFSNGPISGSLTVNGNATVADDATLDQQDTSNKTSPPYDVVIFGQATTSGKVAQQFTIGSCGQVGQPVCSFNRFSVQLQKMGSPDPTKLYWRIANDTLGHPGSTIYAFDYFDAPDIIASLGSVYVNISSPISVTPGQKLWILLDPVDTSISPTNYWAWGKDTASSYAGGSASVWNGTSWVSTGADLNFKTWFGSKYQSLSNVTVTGDAWASNILGATVNGNAYYQTITASATVGTGNLTDTLPAAKTLPITGTDISTWESQIQTMASSIPSVSVPTLQSGGTLTYSPPTTYYYKITAVVHDFGTGTSTLETAPSIEVSKQVTSSTQRTIQLSWPAVSGAISYNVYRTTSSGSYTSPALLANLAATANPSFNPSFPDSGSSTLQPGTPCPTNYCLGWQIVNGDLDVTSNLTLTGSVWVKGNITTSNNVTIKVADSTQYSSRTLLLLADDPSNPNTKGIIDVSNGDTLCGSTCSVPANVTTSLTSGSSTLTVGTKYYYVVTAIDAAGVETGVSTEVSATPSAANPRIRVSWNTFTGATSYRVYRTTISNSYSDTALIASPASTPLTDNGLAATTGSPVQNFLMVISGNHDTSAQCTSSSAASLDASNNSSSAIFAAPFGSLKIENNGVINASASYSLCLKKVSVNFVSVQGSINKIWVPSPTTSPVSAVNNSWNEQ